MLTIGETYKQRREFILDFIRVDRELIKVTRESKAKYPQNADLCDEVIAGNQEHIKTLLAELQALARWWEREGKLRVKERLSKKSN